MGFISEEQQAMAEEAVQERTKQAYEFCEGCSSPHRFRHKCQGDKSHECACQNYSCKREREKRSK